MFEKENRRISQTEKTGQQHTCSKKCASQISNTERIAPPSSKNAKHTRKDKEKFPERDLARKLVRKAIQQGKLIRPDTCEYCLEEAKTEAHHPEHSQPFLLVWLCTKCHKMFDKNKIFGYETDYSEQVGYAEDA